MAKKGGAKTRSPKQAPALTRQTWAKWIDFIKDNAKPEIFFVIWRTGALGLRCGEAVALRREDFGLDAEEPYVCAAGHTEGAKKSPGCVNVNRSNWRFLKGRLGPWGRSTAPAPERRSTNRLLRATSSKPGPAPQNRTSAT